MKTKLQENRHIILVVKTFLSETEGSWSVGNNMEAATPLLFQSPTLLFDNMMTWF